MIQRIQEGKQRIDSWLWHSELDQLPGWQAWAIRPTRILLAVIRDLTEGQLTLRAMSLVYTTLLSLAPLLAVSFSVLKAFGVHNQIEPMLLGLLEPLGDKAVDITANIIGFVENIKVGVLGALGLALLFYSVIALMQKIEASFNYTWRIRQARPFSQKFSDYLSVLMIGPVLVFSALGITATLLNSDVVVWLANIEPFGALIRFFTRLIPYLLIIAAFSFIYAFIPNTRVSLKAALIGGLVAGALWQTLGWAFAKFTVNAGNYTAIYSAFATLIFFLIWLHLGWLIVLTGASIAFYVQNPHYVSSPHRDWPLSINMQERLALLLMSTITEDFYHGREPPSAALLAQRLRLPDALISAQLDKLQQARLVAQNNASNPGFLPASAPDELTLQQVLDAVRSAGEEHGAHPQLFANERIEQLFGELNRSRDQILGTLTTKQLICRHHQPGSNGGDTRDASA